jgi:hypothetical protein
MPTPEQGGSKTRPYENESSGSEARPYHLISNRLSLTCWLT